MVIGTPGRVLAMLDAGYIDPSALRTLVLDEADTLLNMGFEEEARRILPLPTAHCWSCSHRWRGSRVSSTQPCTTDTTRPSGA